MSAIKSTAALIGNFMHAHALRLCAGGSAVRCRSWSGKLHVFRPEFTRAEHAEVAARFIDDAFFAVDAYEREVRLEKVSWYAIDGTMCDQSNEQRTHSIFRAIVKTIDPESLAIEVVQAGARRKAFQEAISVTA